MKNYQTLNGSCTSTQCAKSGSLQRKVEKTKQRHQMHKKQFETTFLANLTKELLSWNEKKILYFAV